MGCGGTVAAPPLLPMMNKRKEIEARDALCAREAADNQLMVVADWNFESPVKDAVAA